ncbi:Alpha/Beta hydrolase protein [Schizophyllum amplum]|uniref:Alpha/Beta hydrolase protein n=1 Tax=Schizophyllum amplum TaxID=97359 RepID=A0A550CW31_9AGAR|nr:Alpha/Beta hydrolase protein [Auriculariopsis ampla]
MKSFAILPFIASAALAAVANVPTSIVDADKDVSDAGVSKDQIVAKFVESSDGSKIYAEAVGDPSNPPLVFVPGYTISTMAFDKQFENETMREQLYMVRFDPRGHGQSVMNASEDAHKSELYADDFKAVLSAFNMEKPVFAAWSLGGAMLTDIIVNIGTDAISGYISIAAIPYIGDVLSEVVSESTMEIVPGMQVSNSTDDWKKNAISFEDSLFYDPKAVPFDFKAALIGAAAQEPSDVTKIVIGREQDSDKFKELIKDASIPMLAINGKQDSQRISGEAIVDSMKKYWSEDLITFTEVDKAGHAFFYDQPEEANEQFRAFTLKSTGHEDQIAAANNNGASSAALPSLFALSTLLLSAFIL